MRQPHLLSLWKKELHNITGKQKGSCAKAHKAHAEKGFKGSFGFT
jgi:hypothetical protein